MRILLVLGAFLIAAGFTPAPNCQDEYLQGMAPKNVASRFAAQAQTVCFSEFSVLVSTQTLTPLWSAEHLTAGDVMAARKLKRVDRFHAEPQIAKNARAELADYDNSGFDRGHMAPSGDMPNAIAQMESFSLANMAPQVPALNRGVWEEIESDVRALAVGDRELYVVTGPMFDAGAQKTLNRRVDVPAAFYKAVYDPKRGEAAAYVAWNEENARVTIVSIARLRDALGFDPFPALSESVKAKTMALPQQRIGGLS